MNKLKPNNMKRLFLITLLLPAFATLINAQELKKEVRQLQEFDRIRVSKGINVTLVEGEKPQAEIHIENAETSDVLIEQKGRDLTIKMRTLIRKGVAVNVYVTFQNLREISTGLGGSVDSDDLIEADQLVLEAGMDGSIDLEVDVKKLVVNASSARVEVRGTADYVDVHTSTGGRFLGANLKTPEALVRANTGGSVQVWVTDKINATAGSGARVEYAGNPEKVEVKQTLGGKVERLQ